MVRLLLKNGHKVSVLDDLSTGHEKFIPEGVFLLQTDLLYKDIVTTFLKSQKFDAVIHFAAKSLVGESVEDPDMYYVNNVIGTHNLLTAMREANVDKLVFSSTAATFGNPVSELIDESHPQNPINPYGQTKLAVERMLADYATAYGVKSVSLRYFNAAGADPSAEIGEDRDPETHLIPNILRSCLQSDNAKQLKVFGDDYDTPDGTCVRDYIHVNDLSDAHLRAIHLMEGTDGAHAFNLGNGSGFSVLEVISAAEKVVGSNIPYEIVARRAGDPAVLVADSARARDVLDWTPQYTDIESIVETAWAWHKLCHA